MTVSRGDVIRVQLDPTRGSELRETRPCVPLTDAVGKHPSLLFVPVASGTGGTTKNSVILCSQIRTIDVVRVIEKLGTLPADVMLRLDAGLRAILDL